MRVAVVGTGARAEARAEAVRACPGVTFTGCFEREALGPVLGTLDVLCVAVPTAEHYAVAEAATKQGVHVFLEWPPATSIRECEAVVQLAEEAGVEAGVSRPVRFHAALSALPAAWRAGLVVLRSEAAGEGPPLTRRLADAVDLCSALARTGSVQRVDAECIRAGTPWPEAVACSIRYHSGAYAQVVLRRGARQAAEHLYAAGAGVELEADLAAGAAAVRRTREGGVPAGGAFEPVDLPPTAPLAAETAAFLQAVGGRGTVPVSAVDALHTMRLVERILGKLR